MDEIIEKWLKKHNDKELSKLLALIQDKETLEKMSYFAFRWTVKNCKELSDFNSLTRYIKNDDGLKVESQDTINAQMNSISESKIANICIKCKKPISGIIQQTNSDKELDVYPIEYLFLSIFEYCGLCEPCISEFLNDTINK